MQKKILLCKIQIFFYILQQQTLGNFITCVSTKYHVFFFKFTVVLGGKS